MLSLLLLIVGLAFGGLGTLFSVRAVRTYMSWPRVNAIVDKFDIKSVDDNSYGSLWVRLRYASSGGEQYVSCYRSLLSWRGERFKREYAVGTEHQIWLDPMHPDTAELDLGWNLETIFLPALFSSLFLCLLLAASYYWRLN